MKNIVCCVLLISLFISCGKENSGSMVVNGNIDGLKKGTVYLQKFVDTLLVAVDSVEINGLSNFILVDELENPEMYFLHLIKKKMRKFRYLERKAH